MVMRPTAVSPMPCSLMSWVMSSGPISLTPASCIPTAPYGLDDRRGVIAGRHEYVKHIRLLVLGALEERREVGNGAGSSGRNGVDHLAAIGLEALFERLQTVLAGREVGIGDDRRF